MKSSTVNMLDEATSFKHIPLTMELPPNILEGDRIGYATGYMQGYMDALNRAREAIKVAVDLDRGKK